MLYTMDMPDEKKTHTFKFLANEDVPGHPSIGKSTIDISQYEKFARVDYEHGEKGDGLPVGWPRNVRFDKDGDLVADVEFSNREFAQELERCVEDGLVVGASISVAKAKNSRGLHPVTGYTLTTKPVDTGAEKVELLRSLAATEVASSASIPTDREEEAMADQNKPAETTDADAAEQNRFFNAMRSFFSRGEEGNAAPAAANSGSPDLLQAVQTAVATAIDEKITPLSERIKALEPQPNAPTLEQQVQRALSGRSEIERSARELVGSDVDFSGMSEREIMVEVIGKDNIHDSETDDVLRGRMRQAQLMRSAAAAERQELAMTSAEIAKMLQDQKDESRPDILALGEITTSIGLGTRGQRAAQRHREEQRNSGGNG